MISILITNYNKEKFLNKNLKKLFKSNYKNFEVLVFDDVSTDNSLNILKKFKKIRLVVNKNKKFNSPALNQIYGIKKIFTISKGDVICLLDGDDSFTVNKLYEINKIFKKNKFKSIYNLPYTQTHNFQIKEKKYSVWPTIFPTSCISLRRKEFKKFLKHICSNKYSKLEIDARIIIFFKFYFNEYNILNKKLSYYNYDFSGIMSKKKKFSINWWISRHQAFEYLENVLKLKKKKLKISFDRLLTLLIFKTVKLFC